MKKIIFKPLTIFVAIALICSAVFITPVLHKNESIVKVLYTGGWGGQNYIFDLKENGTLYYRIGLGINESIFQKDLSKNETATKIVLTRKQFNEAKYLINHIQSTDCRGFASDGATIQIQIGKQEASDTISCGYATDRNLDILINMLTNEAQLHYPQLVKSPPEPYYFYR